jgi:hypothetical protein
VNDPDWSPATILGLFLVAVAFVGIFWIVASAYILVFTP